jgi:hypothetical protein
MFSDWRVELLSEINPQRPRNLILKLVNLDLHERIILYTCTLGLINK